jgi:transcriptional antiterminator NusG
MNITTEKETTMKWYVLRAAGNKERSVAEKLIKEGDVGDLMGKLGRVIVPIENSFYLKNGKKIKRERVKFPGYVFIETNAIGELKFFLKGLNGVSGFLTSRSGEILPLSNTEVTRMIGDFEESKEIIENEVRFLVGEEVKILDGPFTTFNGKIESIDGEKVKVGVLIFGRSTSIDLNIHQIDKKS